MQSAPSQPGPSHYTQQVAGQDGSQASDQFIQAFIDYNFTQDPVFNAGLPTVFDAIRGKRMSPGLIDQTIAQAQWFYFNKINGLAIPFSAYQAYIDRPRDDSSQTRTTTTASAGPDARLDNLGEAIRMMSTDDGGGGAGSSGAGQTRLTFERLCELIRDGKADELRGKDIPDEINALPPSEPVMRPKLKPWERPGGGNPSTSGQPVTGPAADETRTDQTLAQSSETVRLASQDDSKPDQEARNQEAAGLETPSKWINEDW
ncbi:hypothetical protein IAU60_006810 [Kwoniella sp. DSM 27419]